jgi:hypothetical protein
MRTLLVVPVACLSLASVASLACEKSPSLIDAAPAIDADLGCAAPSGGPTAHAATVTGDETWTAAASPHLLAGDLLIAAGGTVRLEPCAVVHIAAGKTWSVNGALIALGTATRSITITAATPGQPWAQLRVNGPGSARLSYATISGGGDPLNAIAPYGAMLDATGDQTKPTQGLIDADHLTLSGSASIGAYLHNGAGFAASASALTITGSASFAMHVWPAALGTIPAGAYTGNAVDEIFVPGGGGNQIITQDVTVHDRGVPYHVGGLATGGAITVQKAGGVATLTIEPGVTLRFAKDGALDVESAVGTSAARGALIAAGTADHPIVFTSAAPTPAAGDWYGIYFGSTPAAADRIDFARVEYAGGTSVSGSDSCPVTPGAPIPNAAIRVLGTNPPAGAFVTHTAIAHSKLHGIDRGWRADAKLDLLASNTFDDVAGCQQTWPKDANGGCPATPPCP